MTAAPIREPRLRCECAVCKRAVGAIARGRYVVAVRHFSAPGVVCRGWRHFGRTILPSGRPLHGLRDDLREKCPDIHKRFEGARDRRRRIIERWIDKHGVMGALRTFADAFANHNRRVDEASIAHVPGSATGRVGDEHALDAEFLLDLIADYSKADAMQRVLSSHPELTSVEKLRNVDITSKEKKP